jgi:hypothetical protein
MDVQPLCEIGEPRGRRIDNVLPESNISHTKIVFPRFVFIR